MSDAKIVLHKSLDKLKSSIPVDTKVDVHKLLNELKHSATSTVQISGQRYTYVCLEDIVGALENVSSPVTIGESND